ncbi:phage tail tape measure protein [Vibrio sp. JC009]|uniref:phage tail tape measure protein n=1 Tax=Vibrio sp. JC009 TaxID=2912314 RepID=UPI0023B004CB|nr:phage tail tape measure protein [Vibrio sp. JC009]WED21567.1 phage tail tape measure protein [Vibrio sp. JC009]
MTMSGKSYLNNRVYILLIDKNLDGLTIPEFRNELIKSSRDFTSTHDARKFIYRHMLKLKQLGLVTTKGKGRKTTYHKTELFHATEFTPSTRTVTSGALETTSSSEKSNLNDLIQEKLRFEVELKIALTEVDEYRHLAERLPDIETELLTKSEESREQSVVYLVKVNALNHAISLIQRAESSC